MRRHRKFLKEIYPVLEELKNRWFPADKIFEDGQMRLCAYCSCNCSRHDKHDDDCILELGKKTLEALESIDQTYPFKKDFKGQPYSQKDMEQIIARKKVESTLSILFSNSSRFIPLDLEDPDNAGVVCECVLAQENWNRHHPDCFNQRLSKIYSNLFKPGSGN